MPANPEWSVIVPTYQRPEHIESCVASLLAQDIAGDFEIIVVDDGSNPPISLSVESPRLRVIRQENAGPGSARNLGVSVAVGNWIAFTDDDCRPTPTWLAELAQTIAGREDVLVGGTTTNALRDNVYSQASQELLAYFEEWESRFGTPRFFASNNIALSRKGYLAMGGFPEGYPNAAGEDRELCDRWRHRGGRFERSAASIEHYHRLTLRSFWRQHANYGGAAPIVKSALRDAGDSVNRFDSVRFILLSLFVFPYRNHRLPGGIRMSLLMLVSQSATTYGFLKSKLRGNG